MKYKKILLVILMIELIFILGCGKSVHFLVNGNRVVVMPFWDNGQSEGFDLSGHTRYIGSISQNGETHSYYFTNIERAGDTLYDDIIGFYFELDGKAYNYP